MLIYLSTLEQPRNHVIAFIHNLAKGQRLSELWRLKAQLLLPRR
jgi:hypothetical protein